MPRDNRCMYMTHVCFYVCCSDCVGVCWNVCCVVAVVNNSGVFEPWNVEICCVVDVMDVVFSVRVWVHVVNRRVFSRSNKYTFWE